MLALMCHTIVHFSVGLMTCIAYVCMIPGTARRLTKQRVREAIVKRFDDERQDDVDLFAGFVMMDNVQAGLGKYIEALKARTKK